MCSRDARLPGNERTRHGVQQGIGLVDTLVALLLLALSLLGACTMIVRTLGANHSAAVQTVAVDLATDLAEDLRAGSIDSRDLSTTQDWRNRVAAALPIGSPPLDAYADIAPVQPAIGEPRRSDVTLRWWDASIHRPATLAMQIADIQAANP